MDYDKNPSIDNESYVGSDDEETTRKKSRRSIDDETDSSIDVLDGSNPRNIWKKTRESRFCRSK